MAIHTAVRVVVAKSSVPRLKASFSGVYARLIGFSGQCNYPISLLELAAEHSWVCLLSPLHNQAVAEICLHSIHCPLLLLWYAFLKSFKYFTSL